MPSNTEPSTAWYDFVEFLKSANFIFIILLAPLWKWIDSYFKWRSKRDSDFIKSVVKEGMAEEMRVINVKLDDIKREQGDMKIAAERDREKNQEEFLKIAREARR